MKTLTILLLLGSVAVAARVESLIHVSHLSPTAVAVTCQNGADPTGRKDGDVVIISCSYGGK